ncbi:MAG: 50S ribosomal protein L3 [Gemmatimonadota bacterium]|nr:50S ribosomal protein L3 [Gemmatimonadota bacterium]
MLGLIGKKLGMTRLFDDQGVEMQVTVIQAGPCRVTQVRSKERDGYEALQLGFGERKEKNMTLPQRGHLKKIEGYFPARLCEFRTDEASSYEEGQGLTVELFSEGDKVKVTGTTKGRGFQGVVKRHGFSGGDATHGNTAHRVPGSIGASADPARVWKNKKLPGQYGNKRFTVRNLEVVRVDAESDHLFVKGAVPGPTGGLVIVSK